MAVDNTGAESSVPPDGVVEPRKFSVQNADEIFPLAPEKTNVDLMVETAVGLRSVSMAVESLANLAASEVASTRAAIAGLKPEILPAPTSRPQIDENDVSQEQSRLAGIVQKGIQKIGSVVLDGNIAATAESLIRQSRNSFVPVPISPPISVENLMSPDIDSVSLGMRKGKGISDCFFSTVTVSIPARFVDAGLVSSVRVFRSSLAGARFSRPLSEISLNGIGTIMSRPGSTRQKNDDLVSQIAARLQNDGVLNDVSIFNPIDRITGERTVTKPVPLRIENPIDSSVSENPRFMDARRLQDPDFGLASYDQSLVVGTIDPGNNELGDAHLDDLSGMESGFGMVVDQNNSSQFQQIFAARPSGFKMRKIGGRYYLSFDDETVVFGLQYRYYAVVVDKNMIQSNRSPIVKLDVDGLRVPARPKSVVHSSDGTALTMFLTCDDQLVEKFEVWKKDAQESIAKSEIPIFTLENGYSFIDEVFNHEHKSGANWIDRNVIPGHAYDYRIYSVDVFGNKSESPFEVSAIIPDDFDGDDKKLSRPSVLAEVDSKTQKVKITMRCEDKKVKKLRLERRDLTIGQNAFTTPGDSSRIIMGPGNFKHGSYVNGERVQDLDNISMWNGWFDNTLGTITFIDKLTSFDRTYQYRLHGVDDRGNRTSYDYSAPVLVSRRPMINSPVNFSAVFVRDRNGTVTGVELSWSSSSLDVSSEDKLGSQTDLLDTSVRTLYQLERQKEGDRWLLFNMTENQKYFDPIEEYAGQLGPEFRPPFLRQNTKYNYRLQAVMSGGYVSNKTDPISVFVGQNLSAPADFSLKTPDPRIRPFYVMLNWSTLTGTAVVDRWQIDRCEINNFAASRINFKNQIEFESLNFAPYRIVFRESSRFQSFWTDYTSSNVRSPIVSDKYHFMDANIVFGNTYFYRISAIDSRGVVSAPSYRGIRITYPSFERMMEDVVSEDERRLLSNHQVPMRPAPGIIADSPYDTLSLNPTFSTPLTTPTSPAQTTRFGTFVRNQ